MKFKGLENKYSDPDRNRTYNLQLRRLLLYPVELLDQKKEKWWEY
jgi:hypothetical protein